MDRSGADAPRRAGVSHQAVLVALVVVLVVGLAVAWKVSAAFNGRSDTDGPTMHVVQQDEFIHEITERGNVESASNIEVRCEVQSQNSAGTRIIEIIPEGTYVRKGDLICRLDSSALENDRMKQQTTFHTAEADLIQAKNDVDTADIAREEYDKGQFTLDRQTIESEQELANETERRADSYLKYSEKLRKKGFVSGVQLEADRFALRKAGKDKEAADQKLKVLSTYTRKKTLGKLQSDIDTAKAKHQAKKATLELEKKRLDLIVSQIEKCTIKAPEAGQVVYATNTERWGNSEQIIEEGAQVRERQVIVRLPDPKRMQVKGKVNESKVALVRAGQPVEIRVDAYRDVDLSGIVEKVSEYPAQSSWWASNIKEYETIIRILDAPITLRPGYTAEVRIRVAERAAALQVPVQSVLEHGARYYCILRDGNSWEAREVKVGLANEKFVTIDDGLTEGEEVVLAAASMREKVDLPELPPETEQPRSEADREKREPPPPPKPPEPQGVGRPDGPPGPGPGPEKTGPGASGPKQGKPREAKARDEKGRNDKGRGDKQREAPPTAGATP
jgi:multidrug efflux pump subunit AcrA (membrane-fusion protein)